MEQVEEICDHIVLVNLGKKILDGTVQQIKQDFKENKFSIRLNGLPGNVGSNAFEVVDTQANRLVVHINDGFKSNDVLQYFINQHYNIEAFNEILPSLNDIFIHLVEGTRAVTRSFQQVK
jgi:ABC-2 type transport system ATP-binding protein